MPPVDRASAQRSASKTRSPATVSNASSEVVRRVNVFDSIFTVFVALGGWTVGRNVVEELHRLVGEAVVADVVEGDDLVLDLGDHPVDDLRGGVSGGSAQGDDEQRGGERNGCEFTHDGGVSKDE